MIRAYLSAYLGASQKLMLRVSKQREQFYYHHAVETKTRNHVFKVGQELRRFGCGYLQASTAITNTACSSMDGFLPHKRGSTPVTRLVACPLRTRDCWGLWVASVNLVIVSRPDSRGLKCGC